MSPDAPASSADSPRSDSAAVALTVVGVGASAGGLAAFLALLRGLNVRTGFSFVLVQHLDAEHPSMLTQILAPVTEMTVCTATDGVRLAPDHVYVMSGQADVMVEGGVLRLVPRPAAGSVHLPIDRLLSSLAADRTARAIGVILSGTGADGAAGVRAIKLAGGLVFAQDASAKWHEMPAAAVATGSVDFVLAPEAIATELIRLSRHPYLLAPVTAVGDEIGDAAVDEVGDEDAALRTILSTLRAAVGIDFTCYRQSTVRRRILRRLALRGIDTVSDYASRLASDADELRALERDLLIGVTRFFRDPELFASLTATVFPALLRDRAADRPLRIWVPGCSTGEEAVSIAIALHEHMAAAGVVLPVQIYASDVNAEAITAARSGRYSVDIEADVSRERLARFFKPVAHGYQVGQMIRAQCVFSRHNLLEDPPFSRLDLISCRNVLMYLSGAQQSVVRVFHYALNPDGFLSAGGAATAPFGELFAAVDRTHGLFRKREVAPAHRLPSLATTGARAAAVVARLGNGPVAVPTFDGPGDDLRKVVDRLLLGRLGPAAIVVAHDLEVLEIRGDARQYLALPDGALSFHLLKLLPQTGLFLQVERLVREAERTGEPARQEQVLHTDRGTVRELTLEAIPLQVQRRPAVLVVFLPTDLAAAGEQKPVVPADDAAKERHITTLTRELDEVRRRLLALTQEYEVSKDEVQNATEELLSSNEELRSVNEELETAKEELQCTNEELLSVNGELQATNGALLQARDQALSILAAVRIPLLVVDRTLRVVSANPALCHEFRVEADDLDGQPLFAAGRGMLDLPKLRAMVEALRVGAEAPSAIEIVSETAALGRRSLAIQGCRIAGLDLLLLSIEDVTGRRADEEALRKAEDHLRQTQKLEAIGRLAGGIAHDFNNVLTAIHGYCDLLFENLAGNPAGREIVQVIRGSSEKAAGLTRQLLAFGRRQVLQPKVVDLNAIVVDFGKMLARLVGEHIHYSVECAEDLAHARVDPGEIGRVVVNLALNARDAMPDGGSLTLRTANLQLSAAAAAELEVPAGPYVDLSVADTGYGIDRAVLEHIFEPFFTTKELGQGSGLGLATVLGIVRQSGGAVRCQSQPGVGTTFSVLLPAVVEALDAVARTPVGLAEAPTGTEVILLVEDEPALRKLCRRILEGRGYTVLEAGTGREGITVCDQYPGRIHLLATDLVMPDLGGREMVARLRRLRPDLRIVFMSGYTPDERLRKSLASGAAFLQKPFTPVEMAQLVRRVLDGPPQQLDLG